MVTGGKCLKKFTELFCSGSHLHCTPIKPPYFIIIFGSVHLVLSHLPDFNSIGFISLAAAIMSICYSFIAWIASLKKLGAVPHVDYSLRASTEVGRFFQFLAGLGDVAFAYAGHNVVLEIQAGIPATPERPSKKPMWKGVIVVYIIVALCYLPVAFIGYWAFGNSVEDNVLISLDKPVWLVAIANLFVVVHVIGSYQVFAMPVFDMMESYLVKNMHFKPCFRLRFITQTSYVLMTMFIAIAVPFFGGLLGFFGGFAFAPTSYYLPCIIWLAIKKPERFSLSWFINWICIILGVLLMLLAPIGGLRELVLASRGYKFFS